MTRLLLTGARGQVGRAVLAQSPGHGVDVTAGLVDVTDRTAVAAEVAAVAPDVVLHAAAWTDVDGCELDPERAELVNAAGTAHVADAAAAIGAHVVYVSTNFVFDGTAGEPYREDDPVSPVNAYGRSKLLGEELLGAGATLVRTGWICGDGPRSLVPAVLAAANSGQVAAFVDDHLGQPTEVRDLADALLALAAARTAGTWHVAGPEVLSPYGLAQLVLRLAGLDPGLVVRAGPDDPVRRRPAPRPVNGVLDTGRWSSASGQALRPLEESLGGLVTGIAPPLP